tara:strand:- start:1178 stop:4516 length:3339 start_codon:yes stop_codon:yes gene_type:complete
MKNKKKESKLFFDNTQKKCDEILEHTNKLVLKNVFIEKQQSITTLFKEKMFAFKSFLKICEEIYFYNESNKFIQENIVEISLEKISEIQKFAKWYERNIILSSQSDILDGTIIQMMNKYLSSKENNINKKLKLLIKNPNVSNINNIIQKVNKLIDIVPVVDLDDKDFLEKQIVMMSNEIAKNKQERQKLNQLLVKTMVLTGAESGTIYSLKENALHFLLIFNHAMEINSMESEKLAKNFPPIQLYNPKTGKENIRYISVYSAIKNKVINVHSLEEFRKMIINDIHTIEEEKVGPDLYQQKTGYIGKTFLCAPIKDKKENIIGIFQLSNRINPKTGDIIPFSFSQEKLIGEIVKLASDPLIKLLPIKFSMKLLFQNILKKIQFKNSTLHFYKQLDEMDCGPTCLKMITKYYGKAYSSHFFREKCFITNQGVTMRGISQAAEWIGFRTEAYFISFDEIFKDILLPCIANWGEDHFIIIYKIEKNMIWIADPATGLMQYSKKEFKKEWESKNIDQFIAILTLEPTPYFYSTSDFNQDNNSKLKMDFIFNYLKPFKSILFRMVMLFILGVSFSLVPPFLIQAIVDYGIAFNDENIVFLLLGAQLMLFSGVILMTIFTSWMTFYIGRKVNLSLMSDFINKLLNLNVSFFDIKTRGDILQRISDNDKIKFFLSYTTLESLFNAIIIICFSVILLLYNVKIFLVFAIFTFLSIIWSTFMVKKQKQINIKRFEQSSNLQSMLIEMLEGIHEIKVNSIEKEVRWRWRSVNSKYENIQYKWLSLKQTQKTGNEVINQLNNILVTFLSVLLVIQNEISLGSMMAIQFIIGQLNTPTTQFNNLMFVIQDNMIALERLSSVHLAPPEEPAKKQKQLVNLKHKNISLNNVAFCYEGSNFKPVLKNITLTIPENKITAIVGKSGSGKSTLLKLLYKFYNPTKGIIEYGETNLKDLIYSNFRANCGVVLQDGFIFSDSIEGNICLKHGKIDNQKFVEVTKIACVNEFVYDFDNGYDTKIGNNGISLSKGQCQRIFIARALYKNPEILILDEATAALDAAIEKKIIENIKKYCQNITIVIVAHRLSMVKNADQIAMIKDGEIIEIGKHSLLLENKGAYFNLIKDQIDHH